MASTSSKTAPAESKIPAGKTPSKSDEGSAPLPPLTTGGLELVMLRNNFYRDNFRRLMLICLALLLIIGGLIAYVFYQQENQPRPQYFATTTDGKLIKLIPLSQPNLQTNALLQWAVEAATASYTFNFVNYRKALQDVRIYYTQTGYQNFLKALQDSRNLDAVKTKKLVVSAVVTGAPVILKEGQTTAVLSGENTYLYAWQVQFPMMITYQSASDLIKQNIVATMLITRVPTLEAPSGVGIASFVVRET